MALLTTPFTIKSAAETKAAAQLAQTNNLELALLTKYQAVFEHVQTVAANGLFELSTNEVAVTDIDEFTAYARRWGYTVSAIAQTSTTTTSKFTRTVTNTVTISWKNPLPVQVNKALTNTAITASDSTLLANNFYG